VIRLIPIVLVIVVVIYLIWRLKGGKTPVVKSEDTFTVKIDAVGKLASIAQLPVWFDHEPNDEKPTVYENTHSAVEPWGEYVYYLAGDYNKDIKGYLHFMSPSTVFRVEVTLEKDSIGVAKIDGDYDQRLAEKSTVESDELLPKTVGQVIDFFDPETNWKPHTSLFSSLMHLMPVGADGGARLVVRENWLDLEHNGYMLMLVYEEFRTPTLAGETERLTTIVAHCTNLQQALEPLLQHFIYLVDRYKNMPYKPLSGATKY